MTRMLRRFPMTIAPLALLAGPLGCGSESPSTPVAEAPAVPTAVEGPITPPPAPVVAAEPAPIAPTPMPSTEMPGHIDQAVQRTAGAVKDEVVDLKVDATRSANEAVDGVKDLGEKARQDAEKAAGRIKGGVEKAAEAAKGKVRDVKGGVKKAVQDAKDEADRRAKALADDARKAAEDALDNLLGSPK